MEIDFDSLFFAELVIKLIHPALKTQHKEAKLAFSLLISQGSQKFHGLQTKIKAKDQREKPVNFLLVVCSLVTLPFN